MAHRRAQVTHVCSPRQSNGHSLGMDSDVLGMDSDVLGMDSDVLGMDSGVLGMDSDVLGMDSDVLGMDSDVLWMDSDGLGMGLIHDWSVGRRSEVDQVLLAEETAGRVALSSGAGVCLCCYGQGELRSFEAQWRL
ncbi:unnamed protein product [Bemisia tabaci]|uniref:Uncharacterized protein n=1 Tax=Bemisia tabaci TaxID=7038 RepID=A0A9P0F1C9_BEMTA|nr:unnamed protein product [Bemisia tabaci]